MTNPPGAMPPLPEPTAAQRETAYDMLDRRLRNSLGDADYAEMSAALECLYAAPLIARVAELEAENEVLREALDWCVAEINRESPAVVNARAALTPHKGLT